MLGIWSRFFQLGFIHVHPPNPLYFNSIFHLDSIMFINDHIDLGRTKDFTWRKTALISSWLVIMSMKKSTPTWGCILSLNCFTWTVQLEFQNEICETAKRKTYSSDMLFQDGPGSFEDRHVCCWEVEVVHVPRQLGILPCRDIWDKILLHKYLCLPEVLYIFLSDISDLSFCLGLWLFCN